MPTEKDRNEYLVQQDITQRTPAKESDLDDVSASFVRFQDMEDGSLEQEKEALE
ncbi:hypothetical protein LJC56_00105 [Christensenellaceae bacterium OttesenSCG-928-K19]|nr:hypothetical protein [Christensenellaceae bacterium OttesenSCG-928-K19]